jgi:formate hydrogenlyase transcriptional activator
VIQIHSIFARWDYNSGMASAGQSIEQLRQAQDVDAIPTLAWSARPDGSAEFLNRRWLDYTGLSAEEASDWGWTAAVHTEDRDRLIAFWRHLLAFGEPGEIEARLRRYDGEYRWFLFRVEPVRGNHGNIFKWYGANTDIEDRKRAEALLAAEKQTLEMIANGACLPDILEKLCETIDAQSSDVKSSVMLMDPDGMHLRHAAGPRVPKGWIEAITPLKIGPCIGSCGTAASLKKRVIVSDIATDPLWANYGELALSYGLRAAWSQPLLSKNQQVLGTFGMYYPEARTPSETDLRLIEGAGHIAVIAIEGERSQEALRNAFEEIRNSEAKLRQDERELRQLIDFLPQHVLVLDKDGTLLQANKTLLHYKGLTLEEMKGAGTRERIRRDVHPEDLERFEKERSAGLSKKRPFEMEKRLLGKDGRYRWFLVRCNPVLNDDGDVVRWFGTATDIEDRRQAENRVRNENVALREEIERSSMFEEIVGSSKALRRVLAQVSKVAPMDSTVLISGETGTGKELIARAIHNRSNRSSRAFIRVNCAAISPSLIASELFGHERGSFTGAHQRRLGRFESADGGTIFLDEVGEIPPEIQVALLRVLQEHEFERVGGNQTIPVDVRVLAATNKDLRAAVADGTFRQDLFYRLNVVPIQVPALRDRVDDIPLLVEYLVDRYAKKAGKRIRSVSKNTLNLFQGYDWPGNIRELQNVVERAVVLCEGEIFCVDPSWLAPASSSRTSPNEPTLTIPLVTDLAERERAMIENALREAAGLISGPAGAAAKLGVPRQTLESKIRKLGINRHRFRTS